MSVAPKATGGSKISQISKNSHGSHRSWVVVRTTLVSLERTFTLNVATTAPFLRPIMPEECVLGLLTKSDPHQLPKLI
jgi:hypothetical protein